MPSLAEKKATKKAKKVAAAAAAAADEEAEEEDPEAAALAAKKAAKKAKKAAAAAAAAAEEEAEEEDPEAVALAAGEDEKVAEEKAAKKAKKAAAAAAAALDLPELLKAKKAFKKAKKDCCPVALAFWAAVDEKVAKKAKKAASAAAEEEATAPKSTPKEAGKKAEPAKAAAEDEAWKDNTHKCCDCSEDWIDTAEHQEWRPSMGFGETPKRCKDCRWAKKVRMEGGDRSAKGKGKKGKGKGGGENTVFARGLPFGTTEIVLTKDFVECGEIASLRTPLDDEPRKPRGFAFITYTEKAGTDKAMAFNETDYGGRTIGPYWDGRVDWKEDGVCRSR